MSAGPRPPRPIPSPKEAVALQRRLAPCVVHERDFDEPRTIAGVDVSLRGAGVRAAIVVFRLPELVPVETALAERPVEFPYVPGLLSFRELPAVLDAWERLAAKPDLLLVDGHGIAHPRRIGIASHVGLAVERPSIGCGKSRLIGEHREPGPRRGSSTQLRHKGEVIGRVLRTRDGVRPLYVSIGHRIDLASAVRFVLASTTRTRLPEPIRAADACSRSGRSA